MDIFESKYTNLFLHHHCTLLLLHFLNVLLRIILLHIAFGCTILTSGTRKVFLGHGHLSLLYSWVASFTKVLLNSSMEGNGDTEAFIFIVCLSSRIAIPVFQTFQLVLIQAAQNHLWGWSDWTMTVHSPRFFLVFPPKRTTLQQSHFSSGGLFCL